MPAPPIQVAARTLVCLALGALAIFAAPAAAAELPFGARPTLVVSGTDPVDIGSLMPGDALPTRTISIATTGPVTVLVRPHAVGSTTLAEELHVRIIAMNSGSLSYEGPLADAWVSLGSTAGESVAIERTWHLLVEMRLPRTAGNEVADARLSIEWFVQGTDDAAP
jgi:hypothetical protein